MSPAVPRRAVARVLLAACAAGAAAAAGAAVVLIDPGHGGSEKGALGSLPAAGGPRVVMEKDLALQIARRIKDAVAERHSVHLTRSVDRDVPLEERALLAEKVGADLFLSVHVNSSVRSRVRGLETYYLDNHEDAAVRKLEEAENRRPGGGDDDPVVRQILTDLVVRRSAAASRRLAESVHRHAIEGLGGFGVRDRGVRPGLFHVLALSQRPSVLLEVGFMSNPGELERISSPEFQEAYAKAVARGVAAYLEEGGPGASPRPAGGGAGVSRTRATRGTGPCSGC